LSSEQKARAELAADRAHALENATANEALATMTGDKTKLLNRLTPASDAGVAKVAGGALTREEGRVAKVVDAAPAREEPRAAKLADRPLTEEERRAAKLAERPLTEQQQRMVKALERHPDPDNYRMAGARARATGREVHVVKQAQVGGVARGEHVVAQAEASGGALHTQAIAQGGGPHAGGPAGGGTGGPTGGGSGSTAAPHSTGGKRRIVVAPEPVSKVAPPKPPPVETPKPKRKRAGYTAQDEMLHQHVLERLAEQVHAKKADPTSYLCVHDSATVNGKRYGGGNRMDQIAEKLHDASDLRAQARKKRLDISHNPHELEINLIHRYDDLRAEYERLDKLSKFEQVDEYEHLDISPERKWQIQDELKAMRLRQVGALEPDMLEVYFGTRRVEIADITLTENDPYHRFKTKVYKRIMEEMLPGFEVLAYDIKPKSSGLFMFSPVD
jgi:hypothetical protein